MLLVCRYTLLYITYVSGYCIDTQLFVHLQRLMSADQSQLELIRPVQLNLQTDYEVNFTQEDNLSTTIHIQPVNPILRNFRSYKLSCCTNEVTMVTIAP